VLKVFENSNLFLGVLWKVEKYGFGEWFETEEQPNVG
jgi:hypothetical protein